MRSVLFEEDMPRQLRRDLPECSVRIVQEEGWSSVKNGELLHRASEKFEVLITADQRIQYQQNIARFTIGVVVIESVDTRLPSLRSALPELKRAIQNVRSGSVLVVKTA